LGEFGVTLKAGEIVLSGALTAALPIAAGDAFRAEFDRLGSAAVRFV
jgi:2-keto-4-pentenoate hydratase